MNIKNIKNVLPEIISEEKRVAMGFKYLGEKAVPTVPSVPSNKLERLPDFDVMEFSREFLQNTTRENMLQQNKHSTDKILLNMQDAINNLL